MASAHLMIGSALVTFGTSGGSYFFFVAMDFHCSEKFFITGTHLRFAVVNGLSTVS